MDFSSWNFDGLLLRNIYIDMFFNVFLNDDDYVVVIVEIFRILKYANLSRTSNLIFSLERS